MTQVSALSNQPPTQDRLPQVREKIDRVGVSGLRTNLRLRNGKGDETSFLTEIDLYIDLDTERKGIHMSRLVESINEIIENSSRKIRNSFEQLGADILGELKSRHKYSSAIIEFKTTMFMRRHTPVTNRPTDEPYDISVKVLSKGNKITKNLEVKAIGNTLCPHSLETTGGKAHVQRAVIDFAIEVPIKANIPLEELIEICEKSFSSPTYTVLKSVDEAYVVEDMFRNPKFVEDVARDCFRRARRLKFKGRVKIRVSSHESIHKHNAISEIERTLR